METEIKKTENPNEVIIITPITTMGEKTITLPYYSKCYLSFFNADGSKHMHSVAKLINSNECIFVTHSRIESTLGFMAFHGESEPATKDEFDLMCATTMIHLNEIAYAK